MNKLHERLPSLLIASAAIIVYWRWFFRFDILTDGDWWFHHPEAFRDMLYAPQLWLGNFGGVNFVSSFEPVRYFFGLVSSLTNYELGERIVFLWPSVLIAVFGSYYLVKEVCRDEFSATVGSIVFCWNSYVVLLRTGHFTLAVAFALMPQCLYLYIRLLNNERLTTGLLLGIVCSVAGFYDFRVLYITFWILLFYFIYHCTFMMKGSKRRNLWSALKLSAFSFVVIFVLNMWWLLPLNAVGGLSTNVITDRPLFGSVYMNVRQALTLMHPFWSGSKPTTFVVNSVPLYHIIISIGVVVGVIIRGRNPFILFFLLISLVGIFLTKQTSAPFGGAYRILYDYLPGFNAFRESSKFYSMIMLGYAVCFGFLVGRVRFYLYSIQKHRWIVPVSMICILPFVVNMIPVFDGNIEYLSTSRVIPDDYVKLNKFLEKDNNFGRSLWMPGVSRWGMNTVNHPAISYSDISRPDWPVPDLFHGELGTNESALSFFDRASIKYVVIPLEDKKYENISFNEKLSRNSLISKLEDLSFLERVNFGASDLVLFRNSNAHARFYLSGDEMINASSGEKCEGVQSVIISPTEYKVELTGEYWRCVLHFSELYDSGWRMASGQFSWVKLLMGNINTYPTMDHFKSDLGFNVFRLNKEMIMLKDDERASDSFVSKKLNVTVFYFPQLYMNVLSIVSISLLLFAIAFCVLSQVNIIEGNIFYENKK